MENAEQTENNSFTNISHAISWFDKEVSTVPRANYDFWNKIRAVSSRKGQHRSTRNMDESTGSMSPRSMPTHASQTNFISLASSPSVTASETSRLSDCSSNTSSYSSTSSTTSESDCEIIMGDSEDDADQRLDLNLNVPPMAGFAFRPLNLPTPPPSGTLSMFNPLSGDLMAAIWRVPNKCYPTGIAGLHEEILDFYEYIRPKAFEIEMRNQLIQRLNSFVRSIWPNSRIEVFGSFKTGLILPTSDMDVVITGKWTRPPLYTLQHELAHQHISNEIRVIGQATVPIVKFVDAQTGFKVDVCFNAEKGRKSYEYINKMKEIYPNLTKLVLVLKLFLSLRGMNEVFTGGLSSYCLTMLVVSFLQTHSNRVARSSQSNLGVLLLEFFELYGVKFKYNEMGIRVRGDGCFMPKEDLRRQMNSQSLSMLCIEDPVCPGNELAKGSFNIPAIRFALENAYRMLNNDCGTYYSQTNSTFSLLGKLIYIPRDMIMHRDRIMRLYNSLHSASQIIAPPVTFAPGAAKTDNTRAITQRPINRMAHHLQSKNLPDRKDAHRSMFDKELVTLSSSHSSCSSAILISSDSEEDLRDSKTQLIYKSSNRSRGHGCRR